MPSGRTTDLEHALAELRREIAERQRAETALAECDAQLRQALKLEVVGQLAGGVAHDFNNFLTTILSLAQLIRDATAEPATRRDAEQIIAAAERAALLTRQLLVFAHQQVMRPTILDLDKTVRDLEGALRRLVGERIELRLAAPPPTAGHVLADPGQLEQLVLNLVVNARDAMGDGGTLTLAVSRTDVTPSQDAELAALAPGPYMVLAVSDTGVGMTQETMARVFEPFFTGKSTGKSVGLSLAVCYGIAKQAGGAITVHSEPGQGTTFRVCLPLVAVMADATRPVAPGPLTAAQGRVVLLVEDDDQVRGVASQILTAGGYEVLAAREAGDALLQMAAHRGPIQLLFTDIVMPGMSGRQLAEHVRQLRPDIRVLFTSGYAGDAIMQRGVVQANAAFLAKPYSADSLLRKVSEVLAA